MVLKDLPARSMWVGTALGTHGDDVQDAEETVDAVSSQNLLDHHFGAILCLGSRAESSIGKRPDPDQPGKPTSTTAAGSGAQA